MFVVWIWSRFRSDPAIRFVVLDRLCHEKKQIVPELLWCNQLGFGVSVGEPGTWQLGLQGILLNINGFTEHQL